MEALAIILVLILAVIAFVLPIVAYVKSSNLAKRQAAFEKAVVAKLKDIEASIGSGGSTEETKEMATNADSDKVSEELEDAAEEEDEEEFPDSEDKPENEEAQEESADTELPEEKPEPIAARSGPWNQEKPRKRSAFDLESMVGGRWSVLLGGLALALGVIFLVKYSIEEGLLGPGARIILGGLFSTFLMGAGEWLRRSDRSFELPVYAKADVPGILTGAGVIGAFATLYAAYELYGFIGPGFAFIAMTAVGIAAMLLSAIHGPKLAAVGIVGAYATPALVSTGSGNVLALSIHVIVVTAVVMALAYIRNWLWLVIAGVVASSGWIVLASPINSDTAGIGGMILILGSSVIYGCLFYLKESDETKDYKFDWVPVFAFGLLSFAYLCQLAANDDLPATFTSIVLSLTIVGIASYRTSLAQVSLAGAIVSLFTIAASSLPFTVAEGMNQTFDIVEGLVPRDTGGFIRNALLVALPPALLGFWGTRRVSTDTPKSSGWLASTVATLAFFGILVAYLRLAPFETRPMIGVIALALAALLAVATEYFIRIHPDDNKHPAPAAFAVGAIACASLAISISLDIGWMPLAFALTALGIVLVFTKRPVATLPWLAVAATGICGFTLFVNMPFELPDVSNTIIFNEMLFLLAVPAAALIAGGEFLRRSEDSTSQLPSVGMTASGLGIAGLFVGLQVTHIVNGGNFDQSHQSLAETAGHALAAMGFAMGLQRIAKRMGVSIYDKASQLAGFLSVAISGFGLLVIFNPFFNYISVGEGLIFNLLLPAYLLTGIAAACVALMSRPVRPRWYTLMYAALSGLLLFSYFSLMLRKSFQGEYLEIFKSTTDLEFWLYSPLWLLLGAILLAIGLKLKSLPLRIASALMITLTVLKVFLQDMSSLEGILRAFSFIGLGLSLIVIGRFYQRILTRQAKEEREADAADVEDS